MQPGGAWIQSRQEIRSAGIGPLRANHVRSKFHAPWAGKSGGHPIAGNLFPRHPTHDTLNSGSLRSNKSSRSVMSGS
jgi:hypothetical protein